MASAADVRHEYGFELSDWDALPEAEAVVAAVPHRSLLDTPVAKLLTKLKTGGCFIDVKSRFDLTAIRATGRITWRM